MDHIPYTQEQLNAMAQQISAIMVTDLGLKAPSDFGYIDDNSGQWLIAAFDPMGLQGKADDYFKMPGPSHDLARKIGHPIHADHRAFAFCVLLSELPKLPREVQMPALYPGHIQIGIKPTGLPVMVNMDKLVHMIVIGATGSGKSNTMRLIGYQALMNGADVAVADCEDLTFPFLAESDALWHPLARTAEEYLQLLQHVQTELERRNNLYKAAPGYPEKLSEYNRTGREELPHLFVFLDEYMSIIERNGGARGPINRTCQELAVRSRKYGVHLVIGTQSFSKDLLGPMRSQFDYVIGHHNNDIETSRNMGIAAASEIPADKIGRAFTRNDGQVQIYYLPKETFIERLQVIEGEVIDPLSPEDRRLGEWLLKNADGAVTQSALQKYGLFPRQIRAIQSAWRDHQWAANVPEKANGIYMTAEMRELLANPQTRQTRQTAPILRQTRQAPRQAQQTGAAAD